MSAETRSPDTTKSKSVKEYASKILKESSVSAVSAIVSTVSVPRKIFRILVFVVFTVGFLYQCVKFLNYVLEYPTVVNVEIYTPKSYMAPAITFCTYNIIKRSKYCETFPDHCVSPTKDLCDEFPRFCGKDKKLVIKDDILQHLSLFLTNESIVLDMNMFSNGGKPNINNIMRSGFGMLDKPFLRSLEQPEGFNVSNYILCHTINDRVDSKLDPVLTDREQEIDHRFEAREYIEFNLMEDEFMSPYVQPGILFSVHSPFMGVNPSIDGEFMSPGKIYRLSISIDEERLLPYPYKTDCTNYTEVWERNNRSGPRSQDMCKEKCFTDFVRDRLHCRLLFFLYPETGRLCTMDDLRFSDGDLDNSSKTIKRCMSSCKDDCLKIKYISKMQERHNSPKLKKIDDNISSRSIAVYLDKIDSEIFSLCYKPQYQQVEAFSYIGGFVGIWLGVSLVQVADVLESLFLIGRYFFRKGNRMCFGTKSEDTTL